MQTLVWIVGVASGIAWWMISRLFGASEYGILGSHPWTGAVSGAVTGLLMTTLSIPVYRFSSPRALLLYSPLSVYLAIACYGLLEFAIRWFLSDFRPDQIPWAVGMESILGMWWGITFLLMVAIPVHLFAYLNH